MANSQIVAVFTIFLLFLSSPSLALSSSILGEIQIDAPSYGPNAFTFDSTNKGFYTSVLDGRVLKYDGPETGFVDFAYASPYWNKAFCENNTDAEKRPFCGRAYDIAYGYKSNNLYIVDCYFHLSVVGPEGGHATQLSTSVEGVPFKWLYALAVDQRTGLIYFTDVSTRYDDRGVEEIIMTSDRTGRLIKYDPSTKETTLLLKELHVPGGAEVGADSTFVLVAEFLNDQILKYWLEGPKKGTAEVLLKIPKPGSIKRNAKGHFWVASSEEQGGMHGIVTPRAVRFDEFGNILEVFLMPPPYAGEHFEQVQEHDGLLYVGTLFHSAVGILIYNEKGNSGVKGQ
uniref:Strictosidine synthase n=1 Tax=Tabernaemontana elegans TaxID=761068 RepID=H6UH12_9GENT|nr:strictosidine synthase [Tabernaemontana elegans]